jgi:hypothetical protein
MGLQLNQGEKHCMHACMLHIIEDKLPIISERVHVSKP